MQDTYWSGLLRRRIQRRRIIAGAGSIGLGAASLSLIGCGDDADTGSTTGSDVSSRSTPQASQIPPTVPPTDPATLLSEPIDSTSKATYGGKLNQVRPTNFSSFDLDGSATDLKTIAFAYSSLSKLKAFKSPDIPQAQAEGDAATSWEVSGDSLTYTFKLRPDMKFDPRPPTNGRTLTAEDVMYSVERYTALSVPGATWLQSKNPDAPFVGFEAPDPSTLVVKLAYPFVASTVLTSLPIFVLMMPVEAEDGYNPKTDIRGTSAWRLEEAVSSTHLDWAKNPDWYDEKKIYLDGFSDVIMSEYSTIVAQFRAGNLASLEVNAEEVLSEKANQPKLILQAKPFFYHDALAAKFSQLPDSPFRDVRVRQAVSMLMDRDLAIETMYNVAEFTSAGLPADLLWDNVVSCDLNPFWLDPKDSSFGPNAKYYQYNPAEAKALLSAAGHQTAIKTPLLVSTQQSSFRRYGAEIAQAMLEAEGDFEVEMRVLDHFSEFRPQVTYGQNQHEGLGWFAAGGDKEEIELHLSPYYLSSAPTTFWTDDPVMDELIRRQRREFDPERRLGIVNDIQRYAAGEMRNLLTAGASQTYGLAHPWLGNFGLWNASGSGGVKPPELYLWIDESQK